MTEPPHLVSIDDVPPGRYGSLTILPPSGEGNATAEERTWRLVGLKPNLASSASVPLEAVTPERFAEAVATLPDYLRELITRVQLNGEPLSAVAKDAGVSDATVRPHLLRARTLVSRWLRSHPAATSSPPQG